ncbi:MAG: TIR domain-containing protein, partial [Anaerolinea sp.]|nr:TIR domain-containing protein [Anaerolinea sp.]
ILPYVRDKDDREALLIETFYFRDPRPLNEINLDGNPEAFTIRLIAGLHTFGCLALEGERLHALAALLLTIHGRCGEDKQRELMAHIPVINALCQPDTRKPETVTEPPAPPANPVQSVKTPVVERTPTVFISYSHVDKAIAEKLIADLGKSGHACWIDKVEIKGGDEWIQSITDGINNSYAFISLVSDNANRSTWVRREFLWAEHKKKPIYPVLVAPCDLPIYVMERQVTDVQSDYAAGLQALLAALPAPRIVASEVDDARTVRSVLATEAHTVNRLELELAYMDRLRFEEFQIDKYVALSGDAHLAPKARRTVELFALHPDLMRQEFAHTPWAREGERETRHFEDAVSELLAIRRVVVLGEPGAGKTTTLWRLARALYDVAQQDSAAPIPLLIKLGKWTEEAQPLSAFIAVELGGLGEHLDTLLNEQRAALLLDGLNEIPAAQHKRKFEQVAAFIRQHPDLMAVITCRKQDYTVDLRFDQVEITPLDSLRIREFALRSLGDEDGQRLFWKLAGESARRQEATFREQFAAQRADWVRLFWLADALPHGMQWGKSRWSKNGLWESWRRERDNPSGLMLLARNPYMLRMLAEVYVDRDGDLPPNRGDLFRSFVERLLIREGIAQRDEHTRQVILSMEAAQLLDALAQLAYTMQIHRAAREAGNALTVLPLDKVKVLLTDRLLYLAVSTSILTSGEEVRFSHQLLQEYFAARYMDTEIKAGRLKATDIWKPDTWWERTNWEEA